MELATFWAMFSKKHLVTLVGTLTEDKVRVLQPAD
jgi:hypothetical protein